MRFVFSHQKLVFSALILFAFDVEKLYLLTNLVSGSGLTFDCIDVMISFQIQFCFI